MAARVRLPNFSSFALEALEQGEGIGRAARKSGQHFSAVQAADLASIGLHHALTQGHLTIAANRDMAVAPHGENGGAVDSLGIVIHGKQGGAIRRPFQALRWRRRARGCADS